MAELGPIHQFLSPVSRTPRVRTRSQKSNFVRSPISVSSPSMDYPSATATGLRSRQVTGSEDLTVPARHSMKTEAEVSVHCLQFGLAHARYTAGHRIHRSQSSEHLAATTYTLRYLRNTLDLTIKYGAQRPTGRPADRPIGCTDSGFVGDLDDRKSTSGYVFALGEWCHILTRQ